MSNLSTVDAEKATATGMKQVSESNKSRFRQYSTMDAFCMVFVAELHLCCREVFSKANGQSLPVSLIGRPALNRERYTSAAERLRSFWLQAHLEVSAKLLQRQWPQKVPT